jgi:hypothetical protein
MLIYRCSGNLQSTVVPVILFILLLLLSPSTIYSYLQIFLKTRTIDDSNNNFEKRDLRKISSYISIFILQFVSI